MRKDGFGLHNFCIVGMTMNAVGIDVSKGKSTIVVMRPFGKVVILPFEVVHIDSELSKLVDLLKNLDRETRYPATT